VPRTSSSTSSRRSSGAARGAPAVADRPYRPQIGKIDDRLRSRFEGGLVFELNSGTPGSDLILEDQRISIDTASFVPDLQLDGVLGGAVGGSDASAAATAAPADSEAPDAGALPESAPVATSTKPKRAPAPPRQPRKESSARAAMPEPAPPAEPRKGGAWFPSRENAVIYWPRAVDLLIEELD
jgi:hypothetical protein